MKRTRIRQFLLLLLAIVLFPTCSEQEDFVEPASKEITFLKSKQIESGELFIVSPNGVDDTDNIKAAFDAAITAGPGSVVEFTAGTFLYSRPIVVANFNGTFRGAGKDQTFIENLSHSPFPLVDSGPYSGFSGLFYFYNEGSGSSTSINFSDFTMTVKGESELWNNHQEPTDIFFGAINFAGGISGVNNFEKSYANLTFERIDFIGQEGSEFIQSLNLLGGIAFLGEQIIEYVDDGFLYYYDKPLVGDFIVKDCEFNTMLNSIFSSTLKDSKFSITRNQFRNVGFAMGLVDFDNSITEISYNTMEEIWYVGIYLQTAVVATIGIELGPVPELFPTQPTKFFIHHNDLYLPGFADGVGLEDYGSFAGLGKTLEAEITDNVFNLENTSYGGIFDGAAQDVLVRDNIFKGVGAYAINISPWSSFWTIHKNQFETSGWTGIENYGSVSRIVNNDYIGYPGWTDPWWNGGGALFLAETSSGNFVAESFKGKPLICNQVLDLGINNMVPGYDVCERNPNMDVFRKKLADRQIALKEKTKKINK